METIIDSTTLQLADGQRVRLAGIETPVDAAVAAAAEQWLRDHAVGREVMLRHGVLDGDRYGRTVAHVFTDGEEGWLQADLVRAGLARVEGLAADSTCVSALLVEERFAREAGLGLWPGSPPIFAGSQALRAIDGAFVLVEGRVASIGRRERTVYLNFGFDWSEDFTVSMSAGDVARFEEQGGTLDALVGTDVRIRGWLTQRDGPWIRVDYPEQIEVLGGNR